LFYAANDWAAGPSRPLPSSYQSALDGGLMSPPGNP
jgi:hypothetical protein